MADYGIFFGFGVIRAGREAALDKVLPEAVAYWDGLKTSGQIEDYRLVMLAAHGGDLSGFALLLGDREKLARLRMTPEWVRLTMRAEACLQDVGVVEAYVDAGFMRLMEGWGEAVADLV